MPDNAIPVIEPGGLIGILGGGQLGRMTAMAARTMGYRVRVMDPEPKCPASFVVDETIVGAWDDVAAAQKLARGADALTLEIEQIGVDALQQVAQLAPLRPGVEPVRIIQDKTIQKAWLAEKGFRVGPFRVIKSEVELHARDRGRGIAWRTCLSEDRARWVRRPRAGTARHRIAAERTSNQRCLDQPRREAFSCRTGLVSCA